MLEQTELLTGLQTSGEDREGCKGNSLHGQKSNKYREKNNPNQSIKVQVVSSCSPLLGRATLIHRRESRSWGWWWGSFQDAAHADIPAAGTHCAQGKELGDPLLLLHPPDPTGSRGALVLAVARGAGLLSRQVEITSHTKYTQQNSGYAHVRTERGPPRTMFSHAPCFWRSAAHLAP